MANIPSGIATRQKKLEIYDNSITEKKQRELFRTRLEDKSATRIGVAGKNC
ncbi:MAG: hypothetical protein LBS69_10215 [Prevotellaceae bacterium]|jgi:hypothetical protein|nr:hypothetical protein [Prevotellaceae bacterium]